MDELLYESLSALERLEAELERVQRVIFCERRRVHLYENLYLTLDEQRRQLGSLIAEMSILHEERNQ